MDFALKLKECIVNPNFNTVFIHLHFICHEYEHIFCLHSGNGKHMYIYVHRKLVEADFTKNPVQCRKTL